MGGSKNQALVMASLAVLAILWTAEVIGFLALAGVSYGEASDSVRDMNNPREVVLSAGCVVVYAANFPQCLLLSCVCIRIPSCDCPV